MRQVLLIAVCGALGAVGRYGANLASHAVLGDRFPFATLAVNVLGCFLLGALTQIGLHSSAVSQELRAALSVGFLGGLTTFSTFGHETFHYVEHHAWPWALGNVAANLLLGLAAVWAGTHLARSLLLGG